MVLASFRFVPGSLFLLSRGSEPERDGGDSDDGHPCLKIDLPLPRDLPLFHDDDNDVHSDDGLLVSRWTSSQRSTSSIMMMMLTMMIPFTYLPLRKNYPSWIVGRPTR